MVMPKILAWFITFNFINISWVFFRAKDWESAIKVLNSMFSLDSVVFTEKHEKYLSFLNSFDWVTFGEITKDIGGDGSKILNWILGTLIILLWLKNSHQIINNKKIFTYSYAIYFAIIFLFSIIFMSVSSYSEFIYFNF